MMNVNESASAGALFLWENWGRNGRFPPISYVIPSCRLVYFKQFNCCLFGLWFLFKHEV